MKQLEFWIEYGSTYTYLSVARIAALTAARGVSVSWQPFYLPPLLMEQGMVDGPFLPYPRKLEYMWHDLERRSARHGIAYLRPSTYPISSLLTARVACVAAVEGWCQQFTERVFALHWTNGVQIGSEENMSSALESLGRDSVAVVAQAQKPEIKDALKSQTMRARERKIFGAPSFIVGDELFWGDDRLEEAVEWAALD